jgi:hypothetical protein
MVNQSSRFICGQVFVLLRLPDDLTGKSAVAGQADATKGMLQDNHVF